MKSGNIADLPLIIEEDDKQDFFIEKANKISASTTDYHKIIDKFQKYLQSQFQIEKLPKKLQNWHELEFGEFIKELNKAIKKQNTAITIALNKGLQPLVEGNGDGGSSHAQPIATLTKSDEMDWMDVFETKKTEAVNLKSEIDKTDKEIDKMVYELYGLSEEEVEIVEG